MGRGTGQSPFSAGFGFFWLKFLFCSLFHGAGSESTAMTAGDAFFSRVIDGSDKY
jgi:hypothetical protein